MASSVKLGAALDNYVEALVKTGRYGSRSEVLREGVRLVQERETWQQHVETSVAEGLADVAAGRVEDGEIVFARLLARYGEA